VDLFEMGEVLASAAANGFCVLSIRQERADAQYPARSRMRAEHAKRVTVSAVDDRLNGVRRRR
jgi:hypothetical protein